MAGEKAHDRPLPACGFVVSGTKKGGFPIAVQTRSLGKKVTVVSNVRGDLRALLTVLTSKMGVGGTVHTGQVEIQGDQSKRLPKILFQLGCLHAVNVKEFTEPASGTQKQKQNVQQKSSVDPEKKPVERERRMETEQATVETDKPRVRQKQRWDKEKIAYENAAMEERTRGGCWTWHGWWPYCQGNCTRPNPYDDDVWVHNFSGTAERIIYEPEFSDPIEGLSALGMLNEPGEAIRAEHQARAVQVKNPSHKPQKVQYLPSPLIPEQVFICKYCQHHFSIRSTLKMHISRAHAYENARVATGGAWSTVQYRGSEPSSFTRKTASGARDDDTNDWGDWGEWPNDWGATTWNSNSNAGSDDEERRAPQLNFGSMVQVPKKGTDRPLEKPARAKKNPSGQADMNCMTEEMFENLLALDFSPAQSEYFFAVLQGRDKDVPMDEAFVHALVAVLDAPELQASQEQCVYCTESPANMEDHMKQCHSCPICSQIVPPREFSQHMDLCVQNLPDDDIAPPPTKEFATASPFASTHSLAGDFAKPMARRKPPPPKVPSSLAPPCTTNFQAASSSSYSRIRFKVPPPALQASCTPLPAAPVSARFDEEATCSTAWRRKPPPPKAPRCRDLDLVATHAVTSGSQASASSTMKPPHFPELAAVSHAAWPPPSAPHGSSSSGISPFESRPKGIAAAPHKARPGSKSRPVAEPSSSSRAGRPAPSLPINAPGQVLEQYRKNRPEDDLAPKKGGHKQQQKLDARRQQGVCTYCGVDVGEHLQRHLAENHSCPMCGDHFAPDVLETHVDLCLDLRRKKEEDIEERVPCPLCQKIFPMSNIAQHAANCNGPW